MSAFRKQSTMNEQNTITQDRLSLGLKARFTKNKSGYKTSRYLIVISINYLLERDQRKLCKQNDEICQAIEETDEHLEILEEKFNTLNEICLFLHTPLHVYFEERVSRLRSSAEQYMAAIEQEIREEVEHWQNVHSVLSQPLLEPGLLRSYYGGLPQPVQQSPASELETICEENETRKSSKKSNRSLASINTFSIVSNRSNHNRYLSIDRFNKTFVKAQSLMNDSMLEDENSTSLRALNTFSMRKNNSGLENATMEDSVIYVE